MHDICSELTSYDKRNIANIVRTEKLYDIFVKDPTQFCIDAIREYKTSENTANSNWGDKTTTIDIPTKVSGADLKELLKARDSLAKKNTAETDWANRPIKFKAFFASVEVTPNEIKEACGKTMDSISEKNTEMHNLKDASLEVALKHAKLAVPVILITSGCVYVAVSSGTIEKTLETLSESGQGEGYR